MELLPSPPPLFPINFSAGLSFPPPFPPPSGLSRTLLDFPPPSPAVSQPFFDAKRLFPTAPSPLCLPFFPPPLLFFALFAEGFQNSLSVQRTLSFCASFLFFPFFFSHPFFSAFPTPPSPFWGPVRSQFTNDVLFSFPLCSLLPLCRRLLFPPLSPISFAVFCRIRRFFPRNPLFPAPMGGFFFFLFPHAPSLFFSVCVFPPFLSSVLLLNATSGFFDTALLAQPLSFFPVKIFRFPRFLTPPPLHVEGLAPDCETSFFSSREFSPFRQMFPLIRLATSPF